VPTGGGSIETLCVAFRKEHAQRERVREPDVFELCRCRQGGYDVAAFDGSLEVGVWRSLRRHERMFARNTQA
jgi:hypothetical protein